jgi:hypothetical protein
MDPCPPEELLALYASAGLDDGEKAAVETHVAGCSACAAVVAHVVPPPETGPGEPGPALALEPGGRLDRYHVLSVAGRGAIGLVYAAYDPKLDRRVALKILRRSSPELEQRQEREARSMARVSSPHVVAVHDVGTFEGGLFVAMDYVDGVTLRSWLLARRRSPAEILAAFIAAGRGLAAAHAVGIGHRDGKPDNVLVRADGSVQVTDFGLARADDATAVPEEAPLDLTSTGALLGTPAYMAPEGLAAERVAVGVGRRERGRRLEEDDLGPERARRGQRPRPGVAHDGRVAEAADLRRLLRRERRRHASVARRARLVGDELPRQHREGAALGRLALPAAERHLARGLEEREVGLEEIEALEVGAPRDPGRQPGAAHPHQAVDVLLVLALGPVGSVGVCFDRHV